jgi:DNA-binding transcriptional ArsR family regulator
LATLIFLSITVSWWTNSEASQRWRVADDVSRPHGVQQGTGLLGGEQLLRPTVTIIAGGPAQTGWLFPMGGPLAIVRVVVNNAFGALANPIRRGIVERLASGPRTVAAATSGFAVSKPAISRHVRVLEAAGVVERDVRGRTHQLRLNVAALNEAADWLDRQRLVWDRMFDAVEERLGVSGGGPLGARDDGDSSGGRR